MIGRIFINYRREQTRVIAQHLATRLKPEFEVFLDLHDVKGGENWRQKLRNAVVACEAVVVLISEDWPEARDRSGQRRLDDPDDPLTNEIAWALAEGIPVLPILIDGANRGSYGGPIDGRCSFGTLRSE